MLASIKLNPPTANAQDYNRVLVFAQLYIQNFEYIINEGMFNDYKQLGSVGEIVMNHFEVENGHRVSWWMMYKRAVMEGLSNA